MLKANVNEIFYSIQGEGINKGTPSIFVRFNSCNLKCVYCDSKYALKNSYKTYTVNELYNTILTINNLNKMNIVFTGGEPLLQQHFIVELINKLEKSNKIYTYEVETNGTLIPLHSLIQKVNIFNISPKLLNSKLGNKRINVNALKSFPKFKSYFKFVICKEDDIGEVFWYRDNFNYCTPIYLMPEGVTLNQIIKNSIFVINLCKQYGFNFTNRDQVIIYGKKRKV